MIPKVFSQHSVNLFIDPIQFGALFSYTLVSLAPRLFPAFSCVPNHAWWRSINWPSSPGSTICVSFLIFHSKTAFLSCVFPVKRFEKKTLTHFEGITLHLSEPFSLTAQSHANSDPAGQSPWPLTSLCSGLASVAFLWMALIVCQLRSEAHKSCVCVVYRRHCGMARRRRHQQRINLPFFPLIPPSLSLQAGKQSLGDHCPDQIEPHLCGKLFFKNRAGMY